MNKSNPITAELLIVSSKLYWIVIILDNKNRLYKLNISGQTNVRIFKRVYYSVCSIKKFGTFNLLRVLTLCG